MIGRSLIITLLAATPPLLFADISPKVSADQPLEFNLEDDSLTAKGNASITFGDQILAADELKLTEKSRTVEALDNVSLTGLNQRWVTPYLNYNFKDKYVLADKSRIGAQGLLTQVDSLEGPKDAIDFQAPIFYQHEPQPHFNQTITATSGTLKDNDPTHEGYDEVTLKQVFFKWGPIPFFYLPQYTHSLKEKPYEASARYQNNERYGQHLSGEFMLIGNPKLKYGAAADYYSKRGFLIEPKVIYDYENFHGDARFGYLNDTKKDNGNDSLGDPIPKNRYFFDWKHKHNFDKQTQLTSQARYWSDSDVMRDFRLSEFLKDREPDNFVELVHHQDNSTYSAFVRYKPNNFNTTTERLPELTATFLPQKLGNTPLFHESFVRYSHLQERDPVKALPNRKSHRIDGYYGLRLPYTYHGWLSLTPVVGGMINHYPSYDPGSDNFTSLRGEFGLDAALHSYGQWDYTNKHWNIFGLRHTLRPIAKYRYLPVSSSLDNTPPALSPSLASTSLDTFDLATRRDLDSLSNEHVIRLGVENTLYTRDTTSSKLPRRLAFANLYQDYHFRKGNRADHWSDMILDAGLTPVYWLDLTMYERYSLSNSRLEQSNLGLTVTQNRRWKASYNLGYLNDSYFHHRFGFGYRINSRNAVRTQLTYNVRTRDLIEKYVSWERLFFNQTLITVYLSNFENARRNSNLTVGFKWDLIKSSHVYRPL